MECHRGRHLRERTVFCAPYLIGRREMMTINISSGRLLMKSRLAGCGFGSSGLCLLAASPSISTGSDAVNTCAGVCCVLGVRECVLLCMPPRSGELCASASFARKKFVLNAPSIY